MHEVRSSRLSCVVEAEQRAAGGYFEGPDTQLAFLHGGDKDRNS